MPQLRVQFLWLDKRKPRLGGGSLDGVFATSERRKRLVDLSTMKLGQ